jgi:hypothetical protein
LIESNLLRHEGNCIDLQVSGASRNNTLAEHAPPEEAR